jgi:succinoglycan biosynthesis transport protein ExoP
MASEHSHDASTLRDYLRIVRQRKWIVLLPVVLVPVVAVFFSLQQQRLYQASADVFISNQDLSTTLSDIPRPSQDPARYAQTQVDLSRVPAVAVRVVRALRLRDRSPGQLLSRSSVSAKESADLLTFRVNDPDPALAVRLANEYARQFTRYRRDLDTAAIRRAERQVQQRLRQFGDPPSRTSPLYEIYANLIEKQEQLRTMEALQASNALLVRPAGAAPQIQPRPRRNAVLGLGLGLLFGLGLAFLWHSLDTRVRSSDEVRDRLGAPLLARIPDPPRGLGDTDFATLVEPNSMQAEAFRMLRTNFEFVNLKRHVKTVMVTSAVEKEGKTTTVANLAVAFARAGHRIVLADLDLRRPSLDRAFGLEDRPGVTDVVLGRATLEEALTPVAVTNRNRERSGAVNGNPRLAGVLNVLTSGPVPPDPGEFVAGNALADILDRLQDRADLVLVDAPPLLHVGDAMTLSAQVDGLIVVTRLKTIRRPMLTEIRRILASSPATMLGFVVTGAEFEEEYGYHGYYDYRSRREETRAPVA